MVPFSILIITHGREELLLKCLDSLRPPVSDWQLIILANGAPLSEKAKDLASTLTAHLIVEETGEVLTPGKARNQALNHAQGEWFFLIDDDAYLLPGYWDIVLPLLQDPKIDVLGGPDAPARGMNSFQMSLSIALASPFCTGNTFSRHQSFGSRLMPADETRLTSANLWIRRRLLEYLRFPEHYRRTEESHLLQLLLKHGAHLYYHPKLKVAHYRRKKLREIITPTFLSGFYRSRLLREKLTTGGEAFWLPPLFVLLHLLFFLDSFTFWILARVYAGIVISMSLTLCIRYSRLWLFPMVSLLHYVIVILYGLGFLAERSGRWK